MKVPLTLQKLLAEIPTVDDRGIKVIPNFGVFIDTHRDQPHIGTFHEDIHRGSCRPTMVHLQVVDAAAHPAEIYLIEPDTGKAMRYHDKHMFVTPEFWGGFLMDYLIAHGESPLDAAGIMVTSHLRDPRAKVYTLKSFRQMLEWRHDLYRSGGQSGT